MRIELRFGLILATCFVFGGLIAGYVAFRLQFTQTRDEVVEKSRVLLEMGSSVRSYTTDDITPLLSDLNSDTVFHPQVVPAYAAQKTLAHLRKDFPDYVYRESSLNPTNVNDRAADWEVSLIRTFQANPKITESSGETGEGQSLRYYLARPLRMPSTTCLECHSTPDAAPKAMVAKYGASNGFGWKMGDVIAIQLVEVPILATKLKLYNGVLVTVGSVCGVFLLAYAIILLLVRRYVIYPLESITRATRDESLGVAVPDNLPDVHETTQFRELAKSIERLKISLAEATRLFKSIAAKERDR